VSFIARASSVFSMREKRIESEYRSQIGLDKST